METQKSLECKPTQFAFKVCGKSAATNLVFSADKSLLVFTTTTVQHYGPGLSINTFRQYWLFTKQNYSKKSEIIHISQAGFRNQNADQQRGEQKISSPSVTLEHPGEESPVPVRTYPLRGMCTTEQQQCVASKFSKVKCANRAHSNGNRQQLHKKGKLTLIYV